MSVAIRSNSTYAPSTATSSHAVPTPTGFQAGDLLLTVLTNPVNGSFNALTGWTELADYFTAAGDVNRFDAYVAWKIATGSEGSSVTFTGSTTSRPAGGMVAISGANTSTPINASAGNDQTTTGTAYTTASITPTVDNCLIIAIFFGYLATAATLSFTPNASFTEQADIPNTSNGAALEIQYEAQTTATAVSGSATASSTSRRYSFILAVAPPTTTTAIKTVEGLAKANVKTVLGLAIANVKTIEGLA